MPWNARQRRALSHEGKDKYDLDWELTRRHDLEGGGKQSEVVKGTTGVYARSEEEARAMTKDLFHRGLGEFRPYKDDQADLNIKDVKRV